MPITRQSHVNHMSIACQSHVNHTPIAGQPGPSESRKIQSLGCQDYFSVCSRLQKSRLNGFGITDRDSFSAPVRHFRVPVGLRRRFAEDLPNICRRFAEDWPKIGRRFAEHYGRSWQLTGPSESRKIRSLGCKNYFSVCSRLEKFRLIGF